MYIIYKDGKFSVSNENAYAVAQMEAPYYIENNKAYKLSSKMEEAGYVYEDGTVEVG